MLDVFPFSPGVTVLGLRSKRYVSVAHFPNGTRVHHISSPPNTGPQTTGGGLKRLLASWLPADRAAHLAVLGNDEKGLEAALARGANAKAAPGGTPLLVLAARRHAGEAEGVARALLAHGADPNARDALGYTALSYCFDVVGVPWRNRDMDNGRMWGDVRPPERGWFSSSESMALDVDEQVPPMRDGRIRSYFRVAFGLLNLLVDAGAEAQVDVAYRDRNMTALWPDPATTGRVAAFCVSFGGWRETALPDGQADADAAWRRVMALVAQGVGLERADHEGCTLLFRATKANRSDAVLALLDAGANPEHRNRWKQTAEEFGEGNPASASLRAWRMAQTLPPATEHRARARL